MEMRAMGKVLAAGTVALGFALVGCGSGSDTASTTSEQTSEKTSESASVTPAASTQTVAEYLKENGVNMTPVKRGDPGAPELNLPIPPGWSDLGKDAPEDAWGALTLTEPASDNPPAIIAQLAKLSGEADHAKILELAPNAVKNQPGFTGPDTGQPSKLGGFDAVEIAGTLELDDQTVFVSRKTVVIPGSDALYVLALDAQGPADQQEALILAMETIDANTTITP